MNHVIARQLHDASCWLFGIALAFDDPEDHKPWYLEWDGDPRDESIRLRWWLASRAPFNSPGFT